MKSPIQHQGLRDGDVSFGEKIEQSSVDLRGDSLFLRGKTRGSWQELRQSTAGVPQTGYAEAELTPIMPYSIRSTCTRIPQPHLSISSRLERVPRCYGRLPICGHAEKMSDKNGNEEDGLTFVVTTNPNEKKSAAHKKRVRSVAALKSWPERRKKTFERYGQSNGSIGGFVLDKAENIAGPSKPPARAGKARKRSPRAQLEEEDLFERCTRATDVNCNCIHCRTERRYHYHLEQEQRSQEGGLTDIVGPKGRKRTADGKIKAQQPDRQRSTATPPRSPSGPSPLTRINKAGQAEPFNCYPVEYHPWFDRVLHHMLTVFAPRGWPALKITNKEGFQWEWFMTQHALSEPALFYVRLLFASGDMIRLKTINTDVAIWLQSQAIIAINDALSDPKRAISDALILAVGRIALHEAFYGDKQAANSYHRPAQRRMIQMRGGMKELPFPQLVKRLMRWADTVMAKQSGTERMIEDDEENENFSMKQHVDVLDEWVPKEGRDLRKKIKISDLLTQSESA